LGVVVRFLISVSVMLAVGMTVVASVAAYDRPPVPINGLQPDAWGQSTTKAEGLLRARYPGIRSTFCLGVVLPGHTAATSSFIHGQTRYWDKLICFGGTYSGATFGLIFDAKSATGWIIYRLRGASISDLTG
jgi:hypothetical protein